MVQSTGLQAQKDTIDLLKKGAMEIARKDADFLEKRLAALHQEMSFMTGLLAKTAPADSGPLLRGLEQLGDRLKSAGRAVGNFGSGRPEAFTKALGQDGNAAELQTLRDNLTKNYLDLSGAYTSLGGGAKITSPDRAVTTPIQKILDESA